MNKKEFIERLIDMGGCGAKPETWSRGWDDAIGEVIEIANELAEPQKPVIPQFVADYIEYHKVTGLALGEWLNFVNEDEFEMKTEEWVYSGSYEENLKREYLLIDAIRNGYKVEKEALYYVRENNYLLCKYKGEVMDYVEAVERGITDLVKLKLTEKEIKDYDERYWAFAVKVEGVG